MRAREAGPLPDFVEEGLGGRGREPLEEGRRLDLPAGFAAPGRRQDDPQSSPLLTELPLLALPGQKQAEHDLAPVAPPAKIEDDLLRPAQRSEALPYLAEPPAQLFTPSPPGRGSG